jgi:hypothetical protein
MLFKAKAVITLMIDGHIREAECTACRERIGAWDQPISTCDQRDKLQADFDRHITLRHPEAAKVAQ